MPSSEVLQKIDSALAAALRAWEEAGRAEDGISVSLRFNGELAPIEALGFETHLATGDQALGIVRFKDLPALVAHAAVLRIAAGSAPRQDLNTAARDIQARALLPLTGAPVDGVWHAEETTGALTNITDATGEGVIVAVIDTGIDFTHPMFQSQLTPTRRTRILRIWDQGLEPAALTECPPVRLLASAETYGVEYKEDAINQALNGGPPVKHKDCNGHGTHVAGIAAGGTTFPAGGNAKVVGVAPRASIIAVKILDNPEKIYYRTSAGRGAEVGWLAQFQDAVLYCLRTAREPEINKPIVINMSFGTPSKPGDGLDDEARFVDSLLDPSGGSGPLKFSTGAIVVKTAGNDSKWAFQHTVPASGELIFPIRLEDSGGSEQTKWKQCGRLPHKPEVSAHFWYRHTGASVQFAWEFPNASGFGSDIAAGNELVLGVRRLTGPPATDSSLGPPGAAVNIHRVGLKHEDPGPVAHSPGNTVHRCHVSFFVRPKDKGTISYLDGDYRIRVKAPPGTVIFGMSGKEHFSAGRVVYLGDPAAIKDATSFDLSLPPHPPQPSSSMDPLGRHVITVAAYNDLDGAVSPTQGRIAGFSARGPLRDFSDPATPLPVIAKPDIAAPGVQIYSAAGAHTEAQPSLRTPAWRSGVRFTNMDGTSMAAPAVAGVIALLLDKNPNLSVTQVRGILAGAARAAVEPRTAPASTNAYGAGRVDALNSHRNTP